MAPPNYMHWPEPAAFPLDQLPPSVDEVLAHTFGLLDGDDPPPALKIGEYPNRESARYRASCTKNYFKERGLPVDTALVELDSGHTALIIRAR